MRVVGIALAVMLGTTVPGVFVGWQDAPGVSAAFPFLGPPAIESLEWSTQRPLADVAFEVRVQVFDPTECRLSLAAAGRTTTGGPEYAKLVSSDESRVWSSMSEDGIVQAHASGLLDTRDIQAQSEGERWALSSTHRRPDLFGNFTWFFAAQELAPWPGHPWTGADALRFSFSCDEPFVVHSMLVAHDAVLVSEKSLQHGTGIQVTGLGTLVREEDVRHDLRSPQARLLVGQHGNDGTLRLMTPEGLREMALAGAPTYVSVAKGPGEYGVGLDCLCQGAFWSVFADLAPAVSLDALHAAD